MFVDVEMDTFNMDVAQVESSITQRTKAILPVHLYGQPVDMDPLLDIARRHGLFVVENAAHAHGSPTILLLDPPPSKCAKEIVGGK